MNATFRRPRSGAFILGDGTLQTMVSLRQDRPSSAEGGGILLGRMIEGSDDVIVDEVTVPTGHDKRTRFFFFRAKVSGTRKIRQAWRDSRGTRNYLGEWHTHPEARPTPSAQDIQNWRYIMAEARIEQDYLFFAILGIEELAVWEWRRGARAPTRLKTLRRNGSRNAVGRQDHGS